MDTPDTPHAPMTEIRKAREKLHQGCSLALWSLFAGDYASAYADAPTPLELADRAEEDQCGP